MITKSDFPALRMRIERGHLVPAGPFDAERINSYRNGAIVMCRFTEEKDRVLIRKWFAVLGLVLKQCQTPWKSRDEAHEAIKLALGIVNLTKTVGGDFMQYPKSLTELDDPEMTEALESMTELLSRMTGVDVATLKKETAHIVEHEDHDPSTGEIIEHETTESGSSPHPEPDADEAPSRASSAEIDESPSSSIYPIADATETPVADLVSVDTSGDGDAPTLSPEASNSENEVLIRFAADLLPKAANSEISTGTLKAIEKRWIEGAIAGLSDDGKDTARLICATMRNIANGKVKLKDEAVELADVLGCSPAELIGAA
jgi:hypothetical protein